MDFRPKFCFEVEVKFSQLAVSAATDSAIIVMTRMAASLPLKGMGGYLQSLERIVVPSEYKVNVGLSII